MAQSKPVPHQLTYFVIVDGQRTQVGPLHYDSRGEATRAKREFRELNGDAFCCAFIDPVQAA